MDFAVLLPGGTDEQAARSPIVAYIEGDSDSSEAADRLVRLLQEAVSSGNYTSLISSLRAEAPPAELADLSVETSEMQVESEVLDTPEVVEEAAPVRRPGSDTDGEEDGTILIGMPLAAAVAVLCLVGVVLLAGVYGLFACGCRVSSKVHESDEKMPMEENIASSDSNPGAQNRSGADANQLGIV